MKTKSGLESKIMENQTDICLGIEGSVEVFL
jgi:hypothetical protein